MNASALLSRVVDNDDLLPKIRKPVLITHGAGDAIVKREVVEQHLVALPHAQIHVMPDAGHATFWDDAASFNRRLAEFCEEVAGGNLGGAERSRPRAGAMQS